LSSPYTSFLAVEYRSRAEREQARDPVAVEIPQYLPQGMPGSTAPHFEAADLLNQVICATRPTERSRPEVIPRQFLKHAVQPGQVVSKDVETNIKAWIAEIDKKLSAQLAAVMHHPDFQNLEATWRGLHYLVGNSDTSARLKIKVLNVSKRELFNDVPKAV